MKISTCYLIPLVVMTLAIHAAAQGGKPSSCSPFPVVVTVQDTPYADPATTQQVSPRITSDGGGVYTDGAGGVTAIVHGCPGGTGDLSLSLSGNRKTPARTVNLDFTDTVYSSSLTPSWLSQPLSMPGLTVAKLVDPATYAPSLDYSFTTGLGMSGFPNPNYYLRVNNPQADHPASWADSSANFPCDTMLVQVHHVPASNSSVETWHVWADSAATNCAGVSPLPSNPIFVGSVVDSRTNWTSVGQARIPFYFTIRRK